MLFYWSLFLYPAVAALPGRAARSPLARLALGFFAVVLVAVIGLRYEVGVDWLQYLDYLERARGREWHEALQSVDPVYQLLNWVAVQLGFGVWFVNLGCAAAFVSGFIALCRRTPNPWLAITAGMPFMVLVSTMNYTRQSAALGLVMWGLVALQEGRVRRFALWIVAAASFHSSAVALMPLGVFASTRNRFWVFLGVALSAAIAYVLFLSAIQEAFIENYLGTRMSSSGGGVRVVMNAVAGSVFLLFRRHFLLESPARKLWTWLAIITLIFIPVLQVSPSSTAVDRVALYFMPIQPFVFGYVPQIVRHWRLGVIPAVLVVGAYAAVLFVWFTYSVYRIRWIPYQFYPLEVW